MRILVCGAGGFVGQAIAAHLTSAGHEVVKGVRRPVAADEIAVDFVHDLTPKIWLPRLHGIDAVVNAVGILVERGAQTYAAIHRDAPRALFTACAQAGLRRVVQISALGADQGNTPYFTSKRAADDFLQVQPLEWQIVRPALVYGVHGASARFFRMLASLPLIALPGGGRQTLQPVHIQDLAEAVLRLLDPDTPAGQCVEIVGARALEYRAMLRHYRKAMGFAAALELPIPDAVMFTAANITGKLPGAILTPDTWQMLQAGNTGNVDETARLLGRPPRAIEDFISRTEAPVLRHQALASWQGILLRTVLAFVWIVTGLVSLFWYPEGESLALLARIGLEGMAAKTTLYSAAAIDLVLGFATLLYPGRRLWLMQIALIGFYTAIIALALPEFLVHPFGPITKNLPIVAIQFLLWAEETRP